MKFRRLKIAGFKSFADPVEFRFDDGLTGVIGPNGCGKSNFMEALRWVMGASSARALRGGDMDDVIFSGNAARPARSVAEVALLIDNSARRVPPGFNDSDILEVTRRITRGQGSTYLLNGREVRARDVQLLFADASTGANSPALVRQGQVSELIAAKPQNRRRILEDAGGVAGLHTRRREAELRLAAAETNMQRLSDVMAEVDGQLSRFRREARQAENYKTLSAQIRALELAMLTHGLCQARDAHAAAVTQQKSLQQQVHELTRQVARDDSHALSLRDSMAPCDEELTIATAIHQRARLAVDVLHKDQEALQDRIVQVQATQARLHQDHGREQALAEDAATTLARLSDDRQRAEQALADAPQHQAEAEAELTAWLAARDAQDQVIEQMMRQRAEQAADRRAALAQLLQHQDRLGRLLAEGDECAREADSLSAPLQALAEAEQAAQTAACALEAAVAEREAGHAALNTARPVLETATAAHHNARTMRDQLLAEQKALLAVSVSSHAGAHDAVAARVTVAAGYEAALAAALGDDLTAAEDEAAARHWRGGTVPDWTWPDGVQPLAQQITAPASLAAGLSAIGVCAVDHGARLMAQLQPGQKLVSPCGQMWRWDGYVATTDATATTVAAHLVQRNRLQQLADLLPQAETEVQTATQARTAAAEAVTRLEGEVRAAERAVRTAEQALATARSTAQRLQAQDMQRQARLQSLADVQLKLRDEAAEVSALIAELQSHLANLPADDGEPPELCDRRAQRVALSQQIDDRRTQISLAQREREARARRVSALGHEYAQWQQRLQAARTRVQELEQTRTQTAQELEVLTAQTGDVGARHAQLNAALAEAEQRLAVAQSTRRDLEATLAEAERQRRASDQAAADARAALARSEAMVEAAAAKLDEMVAGYTHATGQPVVDLATVVAPDVAAQAAHELERLRGKREGMGPVNLRAAEELAEAEARMQGMQHEYADLKEAIDKLKRAISTLNSEARQRLAEAFTAVNGHFQSLFQTLFQGGEARLELIEADDPLDAGLEIYAQPPGKRLSTLSLLSGGEQALIAVALIFSVFLVNPAPLCTLDEVDAPLDDANVDRFCRLLEDMRSRADSRFIVVTHNPVTMARMNRLYGVTMAERGVSQVVTVDLLNAEQLMAV